MATPVKLLMAATVAGVSLESLIISSIVGGIFLVIQGAVQTMLSEYLKEKRDEARRKRTQKGRKSLSRYKRPSNRNRSTPSDSGNLATPESEQRKDKQEG